MDYIVCFITAASREEAEGIAQRLVEERKAACVNIISGVDSLFWWQGRVDRAAECLLIIKTKQSLLNEIIPLVSQLHSYEVPEIIALPIVGGSPGYLSWLEETLDEGLDAV